MNLVELAVRLPDRLRVGDGTTKVVLRRSMTNRLPAPVRDRRDKLGFAAPEAVWLANDLPSVQALVSDGQAVARGWVSRGEARRLIENHQAVHAQLWSFPVTECWLRLTFPGHVAAKGTDVWNSALDAERDRLPPS